MDDCDKKGQEGNTVFCCIYCISSATAPEYDNSVETGYIQPELPLLSLFAMCQALSAEYTPSCLLTQLSGIYSHNAVCVPSEQIYVSVSGWG